MFMIVENDPIGIYINIYMYACVCCSIVRKVKKDQLLKIQIKTLCIIVLYIYVFKKY